MSHESVYVPIGTDPVSQEEPCQGHCCHVFWLPVKPTEEGMADLRSRINEGNAIADMVIPLGAAPEHLPKELVEFLPDYNAIEPNGQMYHPHADLRRGYFYTCKHLDRETNRCTNYENRPQMCRRYPYGSPCFYRACKAECRESNWQQNLERIQKEREEERERRKNEREEGRGGRESDYELVANKAND